MDFHLEFTPRPFPKKISHQHRLLLMGSCFTEQIGTKLLAHKFRVIENPHGILFNPVSISNALKAYIVKQEVNESNLFCRDGIWGSWDHHTRFSAVDPASSINKINASNQVAHDFLKQADWLILTLGSAFVYELEGGRVVANCHKVPTDKFTKRLLTVDETVACLRNIIDQAQAFNHGINIIFTISPVRHLRD